MSTHPDPAERVPPAIAVYGAGGLGREVAWLIGIIGARHGGIRACCFIDDAHPGRVVNGLPVVSFESLARTDVQVAVAVGDPTLRQRLVTKVTAAGFRIPTLVHPAVELSPTTSIGTGAIITGGAYMSTGVRLGAHVCVLYGAVLGHDVVVDDFATISPGVNLAGFVHVEEGAYLGLGANVLQGRQGAPMVIGRGAVVGSGAVVTRAVPAGLTVVGVPAKPLQAAPLSCR